VGVGGAVDLASLDNGTPLPGLPTSFNTAKTSYYLGVQWSRPLYSRLVAVTFVGLKVSRRLNWPHVKNLPLGLMDSAATQLLSFFKSCPSSSAPPSSQLHLTVRLQGGETRGPLTCPGTKGTCFDRPATERLGRLFYRLRSGPWR
jgi:hypothetical protein